jgi:polysaccharide deacetylase 2 family uncharacterized protein YibQ
VAAVVICTAVLGIGGFFAIRSVISGGNPEISQAETGQAQEPAGESLSETPPDTSSGMDILPELEQAIRELEAAGAAMADAPDAASGRTAQPGLQTPLANRKGTLVLVIDDGGNNLRELEPFLNFPGPMTIAVIPGLTNSVEAARRVRAAGKELFLHQPMEPLNGRDPGPAGIKTGMSPAEVKETLVKNLTEIGPVSGFNNHEGSRATGDPAIMRPLLEISRDSGLYFLDSRTTSDTAAPRVAGELGITIAQRDIFLDNDQSRESILAALEAGCKRAEQNGTAILIGHAWSPRLAAILAEMYPQLVRQGFVFATVSSTLYRGK